MSPAKKPVDVSLVVTPDGKRHRVLTVATFKKLLRLRREAHAEGMLVRFLCPHCEGIITLSEPNPLAPELACTCTVWIGR